ncbi:hypothetical protein LCGC14_1546360, partial [marine sediment metagenome]
MKNILILLGVFVSVSAFTQEIGNLPEATTLQTTDVLVVEQSDSTRKITKANLETTLGISDLESSMSTAETDVENIQDSLITVYADVATAETDILNIQDSLITVYADVATAEGDIENIQDSLLEATGDILNIQDSLITVYSDVATAEGDIENIQDSLITVYSDVSTTETDVENIQDSLITIYSDVATAETDIENLQDSMITTFAATGINTTQLADSLGWFNVLSYGADGVGDDVTYIQAAIDAAAPGTPYFPPGMSFTVGSSLTINTNQYVDFNGVTMNSGITNGSPVIKILSSECGISNIYITGNSQQSDGIMIGDSAVLDYAHRVRIINVEIYDCDTAFNHTYGWENTFENILIKYNNVGLYSWGGDNLYQDFNFSGNDEQDFIFVNGASNHLDSWVLQNADASDTTQSASRIDGVSAMRMTTMYFEMAGGLYRDNSWLIIGGNDIVNDIKIDGIEYGNYNDDGVPCIVVDSVNGGYFSGYFGGARNEPLEITTRSRNIKLDVIPKPGAYITEKGDNLGEAYNYFPNGSFEHWFGGWHSVTPSNITVSLDTVHTKSGKNAIKVTGTNTTAAGFVLLRIDDGLEALWGKTVTLGAWVYIPDSSFFPNNATRLIKPTIKVNSYNGGTTNGSVQYQYTISGGWNYLRSTVTVHDDATRLYVYLYLNYSSADITTDMWVTVDDMQLYHETVPLNRVINTSLVNAPTTTSKIEFGLLRQKRSAVPTDADMYYKQGDIIYNVAPTEGGDIGWVCTVAGVGGAATWEAGNQFDDITVTGTITTPGSIYVTDAGGSDSLRIYDDGDTTRFESDNPIKIGEGSLVVGTDGNVGIGESSPLDILHV